MHESALARRLVEIVLERAGEARVLAVRGWVAETERLDPQALRFHFDAHARGTAAAGADLKLELIHVEVRCTACATRYQPEHHVTLCPECGSTEAELLGRTGFGVEAIDVRE